MLSVYQTELYGGEGSGGGAGREYLDKYKPEWI